MKTMFGCSLAAVMGLMLMLGLCTQGMWGTGPRYSNANPRLELPTISHWTTCGRECVIQASLNHRHEWVLEDGKVRDQDLEIRLARDAALWNDLCYRPALRVRIAGREPARHFLRLHQAATSVGIENFSIACFRGEDR